jgi:hypothetical protein
MYYRVEELVKMASCAEHLATAALFIVATSSYVTLRRISTANYGDLFMMLMKIHWLNHGHEGHARLAVGCASTIGAVVATDRPLVRA